MSVQPTILRNLTVGLFACILASAMLSCGAGFIVSDGTPSAEIVIAAQPPRMAKLAAEELRKHIAKITGATLPIVTEPSGQFPVTVYVGRSPGTDRLRISDQGLRHGAFRMITGENWLALVGHDEDFLPKEPWMHDGKDKDKVLAEWDALSGGTFGNHLLSINRSHNTKSGLWEQDQRGSLNAVYEFLRSLGVRWYFPGELGEVIPTTNSIPLPRLAKAVHPDFPVRRPYFGYNSFFQAPWEEILWQLRMGVSGAHEGVPDGLIGLGAPGHGIEKIIGREGVREAHPEYFAIWAGQRVHAPCLSSEGLFQQTVKYVRAVFDVYGEPRVDISPTDGYGSLCQCELCKGKATPERGWNAQLSDYVWGFVDRVAREVYKTHPDRKVGCLAYSSYQLPPSTIATMSPNVSIMLCRWRSNFYDPQTRAQFREITEAWLDALPSKQVFIWDYYLHARNGGTWHGVPVFFPRIIADDLRYLKGKSWGEFVEVQRNYPDWNLPWHALAANHLNCYVTTRLYWDADQDLDALLDDYYAKFYGPAAAEMKTFVEYSEAHWMDAPKNADVIDQMNERIAAARKAAGDGIYGKRVALLVEYMKPLAVLRAKIGQGRTGVPTARAATRKPADIVLDGKLDEGFWDGIEVYPFKEIVTGNEPSQSSTVKIAAAGDNLYFGITCHDTDMANLNIAATEDEDSNLWLGDSVEIMLETPTHSYYQIAISPAGAITDLDRVKGFNTLWSANAEVASHIGDDAWTLEVRIPVAGEGQEELDRNNGVSGRMPSAERPWYFNVCRQRVRGDVLERYAFSPAGKDSFHIVMKFAELTGE